MKEANGLTEDQIKFIDLLDDLENLVTIIHNAMSWAAVFNYDAAMERVEQARRYLCHNFPK